MTTGMHSGLVLRHWPQVLVFFGRFRLSAAIFSVLISMCQLSAGEYPIVKLPSGREIHVIGIGTLNFAQGEPAWWLSYETQTPLENKTELLSEALEVWDSYKNEADKSGKSNAALSANEPRANAIIASNRSYNFVFQKQPDGTWKML